MRRLLLISCILCVLILRSSAQPYTGAPLSELLSQLSKSNTDTNKVQFLLQVSEFYFFKQRRKPVDLDSALVPAKAAEMLSLKLDYRRGLGNSYEQISKILHKKNDPVQGKILANKAIAIFKENNFFLELGFAYFDLAGYYSLYYTGLSERIQIVEQLAVPAFQKSGNKLKEADIFKELGDLQQLSSNYSAAIYSLNKALQIYKSIGYIHLQGTYDLLGHISSMIGNDDQALKYGLLAVQSAELVKDTTLQLATIYTRLGSTYHNMNNYSLAYECFKKSLTIAEKFNDIESILIITHELSNLLNDMNNPEASLRILQKINSKYATNELFLKMYMASNYLVTYQQLRQYKLAAKYCNELLELSEKLTSNDAAQIVAQYPVTGFYLATKQYDLARKHLERTDSFYLANQSPLKLAKNHLLWFKLDSTEHKYLLAIFHYQQYKVLLDASLNEKVKWHILQLQIEFDIDKKDNDIKLLQNESALQQGKLLQVNSSRNWISGVALLLFIITGLLINTSRVKQLSNQKLKTQQKEIHKKNLTLQHLVKEKEWLVKEIHHRIKNNLQTITGLLDTQSGFLKTEEALLAIGDSQHRIQAMSLIHQKLFQSDDLSTIEMSGYIHELVDYLKHSFGIGQNIRFKLDIDNLIFTLSQSLPIGLILNEAITNSIKYAFPADKVGLIKISLKKVKEHNYFLSIADNGIGLPPDFDYQKSSTMGMSLMQGLSEDIEARFLITNNNGTKIVIQFFYDPEDDNNLIKQVYNNSINTLL